MKCYSRVIAAATALAMASCVCMPFNAMADSQADDWDREDSNNYIFSIYPKNQTTYKKILKTKQSVKDIRKENKKLQAYCDCIGTVAGVAGYCFFVPKVATIGTLVSGGVSVVTNKSKRYVKTLKKLKSNTKVCVKYSWKWNSTSSQPYVMSLKRKTWYTYKGEKIKGSKSVQYASALFYDGEGPKVSAFR